jgi:hypothetical protein
MTSPLEREILTHYHCSSEPYKCKSKVHEEAVEKFIRLGLLTRITVASGDGVVFGGILPNTEALRVYMAALDAVPLPVQRWEVRTVDKWEVANAPLQSALREVGGGETWRSMNRWGVPL